jgi:hypothetical protein
MNCPSCGRSTSIWERDFLSKLCKHCQKTRDLDHNVRRLEQVFQIPELGEGEWVAAMEEYGAALLARGDSADAVERALVEKGLDPETAPDVVREIQGQLRQGHYPGVRPDLVVGKVFGKAFGCLLAIAVTPLLICAMVALNPHWFVAQEYQTVLRVIGAIALVIGVILCALIYLWFADRFRRS